MKSPYVCLHPVELYRNGKYIKVPCRKCEACLNRLASTMTMQCTIEEQQSKYCFFVTLTYSNDWLPLYHPYKVNGNWLFVDCSKNYVSQSLKRNRIYEYERNCGHLLEVIPCHLANFSPEYLSLYQTKVGEKLHPYQKGNIPYLKRKDAQDFMKRTRKELNKYTNEKVRYYLVGEYGPKTYRPHFHILFFVQKEETARMLRKVVLSKWPYGRIDFQLSKGKTAGYCAKYVNGHSHISKIQCIKTFRPFAVHSQKLGQSVLQVLDEETGYISYESLNGNGIAVNGKYKNIVPWLASESAIFPKCHGFSEATSAKRLLLYSVYPRLQQAFGIDEVSKLAEVCFNFYDAHPLVASIIEACNDAHLNVSSFQSIIYTSKKFLSLCTQYRKSPYVLLRLIEKYYSDKEYHKLKEQLQSQCDLINEHGKEYLWLLPFWYQNFHPLDHKHFEDLEELGANIRFYACQGDIINYERAKREWSDMKYKLEYSKPIKDYLYSIGIEPYFYTSLIAANENNPLYNNFRNQQHVIAVNSVKHKKLNDLNNYFVYG